MKTYIPFFVFIILAACATQESDFSQMPQCVIGEQSEWQKMAERPRELSSILANTSGIERDLLANPETIGWYSRPDGSFLACIPGAVGVCGQTNYHIEKIEGGWAPPFHYFVACH